MAGGLTFATFAICRGLYGSLGCATLRDPGYLASRTGARHGRGNCRHCPQLSLGRSSAQHWPHYCAAGRGVGWTVIALPPARWGVRRNLAAVPMTRSRARAARWPCAAMSDPSLGRVADRRQRHRRNLAQGAAAQGERSAYATDHRGGLPTSPAATLACLGFSSRRRNRARTG